jgi:hypothetical protein
MKTLKPLMAACVLSLCLSGSAFAGDIPAVGVAAPVPEPSPVSEPVPGNVGEPALWEDAISGTMSLIDTLLLAIL